MLGQVVYSKSIAINKGMANVSVNAELANGIYSIQLSDGAASVTRTLVVQQ